MSVSINFYKSILIQVPVKTASSYSFFGCLQHGQSDGKFCPECGKKLQTHKGDRDVDFLEPLIGKYEDLEDFVSFRVDEGFINISYYDWETDDIEVGGFFTQDTYAVTYPLELDWEPMKRFKSKHSDFLSDLEARFGKLELKPSITRTAG